MAVTELFPKKHYTEDFKQKIPISAGKHIYIGKIQGRDRVSEHSIYTNVEAVISQYIPIEGGLRINELAILEYDSKDSLKDYKMVLECDLFKKRCGTRLLSSVLIENDDNYAYINSGSKH